MLILSRFRIFQSTLPREERLKWNSKKTSTNYYFNPRSHERSDFFRNIAYQISNKRFQSTLPREERPLSYQTQRQNQYFNPRSHERSDADNVLKLNAELKFQSTLPREERLYARKEVFIHGKFQSTLPREERRGQGGTIRQWKNFNPRSHERSDPIKKYINVFKNISIHAPTRGATSPHNTHALTVGFQSTLPREERLTLNTKIRNFPIFQSTLPREERRTIRKKITSNCKFQSTLPREERP